MTDVSSVRPVRWRRLPIVEVTLLLVGAIAWAITVTIARQMRVGPGTMGLGVIGFVGTWALMMAAMMLPSITPFTSLYQHSFTDHRTRRITLLSVGYLTVWTLTGFVAFGLATSAEHLAAHAPGLAQGVAIASCFACGAYQMTSIKDRCLEHCRSPLGHLLHFASLRGPTADMRVGLSHGAWCLACCWSLMVLLVTFGVMNIFAMVLLASIILAEKVLQPGRWFSIAVGIVAIGLGIAIWVHPAVAQGLHIVGDGNMAM